ncbi:MAG: lamin tail domain-containing protein [Chitinispirillia bacterium]|nr:lamin tail domain-containing protein [Chitinispirillia bacterium]
MLHHIRASVFGLFCLSFFVIFFSCSKTPSPTQIENYGTLEIRANVISSTLKKENAIAQTIADSLVVEVSGEGIETARFAHRLDLSRPALNETITKVPVGRNLRVSIWAISRSGAVTHIDSVEYHTANIENARVTPITTTLIPAAGSIYLQFLDMPTNTWVHAQFVSSDENVIASGSAPRSTRTFVSLDNIPHMTAGVLTVVVTDGSSDTAYIANRELTFNARTDNSIDLHFTTYNSALGFDITMYEPGVTTGSFNFNNGNLNNPQSIVEETGELIITEIMWNATNDNYIELYNPSDEAVFFETLTTDVNGTVRDFEDVTVGPKSYLVIGRHALPHVDIHTTATGGLPITSTGNWITIRRGRTGAVIDRVIFAAGTSNTVGWPALSASNIRSIELDRDKYCVTENNFGKNWKASTAAVPIPGTTNQYGTPGF